MANITGKYFWLSHRHPHKSTQLKSALSIQKKNLGVSDMNFKASLSVESHIKNEFLI